MAAPAPAGVAVPDELAPGPGREANKHGRAGAVRRHRQCAGARLLSLAVQAAVMAAALAIFVLFAAASALLLLVLVLAARAFRHHRGSRYRVPSLDPSSPSPPPLRTGLSPADIRLLPSFAFPGCCGGGDEAADSASCAVCLEAARAGERWRAMPACTHAFHAACVDRWLARSPACPVCRTAVAVTTS
ncbi:RING-H2 finger protein ATL66-like [Miscanthus floridulus]|uniref:RING-H2 finger protein ATL66-like n=1 Tax=Miscanthus floridulus TaxID=154761 RepID=UPI0034583D64